MPRKKSADQPVSSSPAAAPQGAAPAPSKSRVRGSSAKVVTHKHKQIAAPPEQGAAEIATVVPAQQPASLSHQEISIRAYLIAEGRGFQGGSPDDDWFRAERELRAERQ